MNSELRERFARLGPISELPKVPSGSPVALSLEWAGQISDIKTITAILALSMRWMPMAGAKRCIEDLVEKRRAFAMVPKVESLETLTAELAAAGVKARVVDDTVDLRATRDRLGLTQEQFAIRFGLDLDAIRNWEHGRRKPDTAARSYLRAIDNDPEAVEAALWRSSSA